MKWLPLHACQSAGGRRPHFRTTLEVDIVVDALPLEDLLVDLVLLHATSVEDQHFARDCQAQGLKCYACGKLGHISRDCTALTVVLSIPLVRLATSVMRPATSLATGPGQPPMALLEHLAPSIYTALPALEVELTLVARRASHCLHGS